MKDPSSKVLHVVATRLTSDDAQRLDSLAQRLGVPPSAVMRRAVRAYLDKRQMKEGIA